MGRDAPCLSWHLLIFPLRKGSSGLPQEVDGGICNKTLTNPQNARVGDRWRDHLVSLCLYDLLPLCHRCQNEVCRGWRAIPLPPCWSGAKREETPAPHCSRPSPATSIHLKLSQSLTGVWAPQAPVRHMGGQGERHVGSPQRARAAAGERELSASKSTHVIRVARIPTA